MFFAAYLISLFLTHMYFYTYIHTYFFKSVLQREAWWELGMLVTEMLFQILS